MPVDIKVDPALSVRNVVMLRQEGKGRDSSTVIRTAIVMRPSIVRSIYIVNTGAVKGSSERHQTPGSRRDRATVFMTPLKLSVIYLS